MNLTIDANVLVSEIDSEAGASQSLLLHPTLRTLYIAEYTWMRQYMCLIVNSRGGCAAVALLRILQMLSFVGP